MQTGLGSVFSLCEYEDSTSVRSSFAFHHSFFARRQSLQDKRIKPLGVPSHPLPGYKSEGSPNKLTSFYIHLRIDCLESAAKKRQNKMGKILYGVIAVLASIVLGKIFFFSFFFFFKKINPLHLAASGHK